MNRVVASALVSGLLMTGLGLASPAWALYKVVGPDGRVTYTDRAPTDRPAQAVKPSGTASSTAGLPFALRTVATRYPVTLYTSKDCGPCDTGRALLKSRGIPFAEKTVSTPEDARALKSKEGTDQVPVIRIGSKQMSGFEQGEWTSYLDAAGYPATSALPATYQYPAPTPLAPPAIKQAEPDAPASTTQPGTAPTIPGGTSPSGFRF